MIFCFVVASKNVGFHIYNLRSFACEQYHIFFNLWGNGGTNWVQEFRKYLAEEDDQWTLVHRKKSPAQKSFRDVVKDSRVLSGANSVPMGRMNQQSKQKASMHRSVFYRNDGILRIIRRIIFKGILFRFLIAWSVRGIVWIIRRITLLGIQMIIVHIFRILAIISTPINCLIQI
jgi:hypothetical protein